jgi:hypothetical protein
MSDILYTKDFILEDEIFEETVTFTDKYVFKVNYDFIKKITVNDNRTFSLKLNNEIEIFKSVDNSEIVNMLGARLYVLNTLSLHVRGTNTVAIQYQKFKSLTINPSKLTLFDHDERYWNDKIRLVGCNAMIYDLMSSTLDKYDDYDYVNKICKKFNMHNHVAIARQINKFVNYYFPHKKIDDEILSKENYISNDLYKSIAICYIDDLCKLTYEVKFYHNILCKISIKDCKAVTKNSKKIIKINIYINEEPITLTKPIKVFGNDKCTIDILVEREDIVNYLSTNIAIEYGMKM